jgi:hypothetical protein
LENGKRNTKKRVWAKSTPKKTQFQCRNAPEDVQKPKSDEGARGFQENVQIAEAREILVKQKGGEGDLSERAKWGPEVYLGYVASLLILNSFLQFPIHLIHQAHIEPYNKYTHNHWTKELESQVTCRENSPRRVWSSWKNKICSLPWGYWGIAT